MLVPVGDGHVSEAFAIQGQDSLVMAEAATGEAAVPEVRSNGWQVVVVVAC